jgi:hypothetical protein
MCDSGETRDPEASRISSRHSIAHRSHSARHSNAMPPRLSATSFARSIPLRPKPQGQWLAQSARRSSPSQCRPYSDSTTSAANDRSKKVDAKPADHVSEEAAKTAQIMGEEGPDMSRGTPIEEVREAIARDTDGPNNLSDCERRQGRTRKAAKGHER